MSVGLDGVVEQQSNYQRSGFEFAYRNIRYQGVVGHAVLKKLEEQSGLSSGHRCRTVKSTDMPVLRKLDLSIHGIDRRTLIEHWLVDSDNRKSLVCSYGEQALGVGTIRRCKQGLKVGPLMAVDEMIARRLVAALFDLFSENEMVLDVPEPNQPAVELAENLGLTPVFETARMYKGDIPEYQLDSLFGVTTFELG